MATASTPLKFGCVDFDLANVVNAKLLDALGLVWQSLEKDKIKYEYSVNNSHYAYCL